jgi:hypothetical protein
MVHSGNIVVFNVTKGYWFAAAQRFFTGMPYSHAAIGFGEVKGDESILEAIFAIAITLFKKARESTTADFEVWRVKNVPQTRIEEAVKRAFERWAGETYGFAQIVWFMYRWLNEAIGRDVRKQGNWFPDHLICSEVAYNYLWDISEQLPPAPEETRKMEFQLLPCWRCSHGLCGTAGGL